MAARRPFTFTDGLRIAHALGLSPGDAIEVALRRRTHDAIPPRAPTPRTRRLLKVHGERADEHRAAAGATRSREEAQAHLNAATLHERAVSQLREHGYDLQANDLGRAAHAATRKVKAGRFD